MVLGILLALILLVVFGVLAIFLKGDSPAEIAWSIPAIMVLVGLIAVGMAVMKARASR